MTCRCSACSLAHANCWPDLSVSGLRRRLAYLRKASRSKTRLRSVRKRVAALHGLLVSLVNNCETTERRTDQPGEQILMGLRILNRRGQPSSPNTRPRTGLEQDTPTTEHRRLRRRTNKKRRLREAACEAEEAASRRMRAGKTRPSEKEEGRRQEVKPKARFARPSHYPHESHLGRLHNSNQCVAEFGAPPRASSRRPAAKLKNDKGTDLLWSTGQENPGLRIARPSPRAPADVTRTRLRALVWLRSLFPDP